VHAFSDLATAAYCPRQLYYRRRDDDRGPPDSVAEVRELAYRYEALRSDDDALAAAPLSVSPLSFRRNLGCAQARFDAYADLGAVADALPDDDRAVLLVGRECRGIAHKLVGDPQVPVLVSTGEPPPQGVWEPQSVRAVAAAKALSYEREREVERAFYEYPAHGAVREVSLTTRRKAAYRRAVRAVESLDGPPPRLDDDAKCDACEYREECGVQSRSLRSLLGL
jgi:CRISPR-associated exonuclease Cas4